MTNKNKTDSLNLAAYFTLEGFECLSITQDSNSPRLIFEFDISDDDFSSYSDFFWSRKTEVDACTYAEALKRLKSRMYQYKNKERIR